MTAAIENLENRRKRLLWRATHRGMREMDLILGGLAGMRIAYHDGLRSWISSRPSSICPTSSFLPGADAAGAGGAGAAAQPGLLDEMLAIYS